MPLQRKACRTGLWGAAALTALAVTAVAGCSSDSADAGQAADSKPGVVGSATPSASPGKYRTLPDPCSAVDHDTLDKLLPGIKAIPDDRQREDAYAGEADLTYDTSRRVGCHWSIASTESTDELSIDMERVVSYDGTVSDDNKAKELFATKEAAAHLPPSDTPSGAATQPSSPTGASASASPAASSASPGASAPAGTPSGSSSPSSPSSSATVDPAEIQPRVLDDLGDEAYLDDELGAAGSAAGQRTITVAFRTSNVIVTVQYAVQNAVPGTAPDSKELQDKTREVADNLEGQLSD